MKPLDRSRNFLLTGAAVIATSFVAGAFQFSIPVIRTGSCEAGGIVKHDLGSLPDGVD